MPYRILKYKPEYFNNNEHLVVLPSKDYKWWAEHFYARRMMLYFKKKFKRNHFELDPFCSDDEWDSFWKKYRNAQLLKVTPRRLTEYKTILTKKQTNEHKEKRKAKTHIKASERKEAAERPQDSSNGLHGKLGDDQEYFE